MTEVFKKIEKHIHYQRADTVLNHIKTILGFDSERYSGNVNGHRFVLWRLGWKRGFLYPVIYGYLTDDGDVKLRARLNIIGVLFSLIIGVTFFLSWFLGSHLTSVEYSFDYWIRKIGIGIIFGAIPMLWVRLGFELVKRQELKAVSEMIEENPVD